MSAEVFEGVLLITLSHSHTPSLRHLRTHLTQIQSTATTYIWKKTVIDSPHCGEISPKANVVLFVCDATNNSISF